MCGYVREHTENFVIPHSHFLYMVYIYIFWWKTVHSLCNGNCVYCICYCWWIRLSHIFNKNERYAFFSFWFLLLRFVIVNFFFVSWVLLFILIDLLQVISLQTIHKTQCLLIWFVFWWLSQLRGVFLYHPIHCDTLWTCLSWNVNRDIRTLILKLDSKQISLLFSFLWRLLFVWPFFFHTSSLFSLFWVRQSTEKRKMQTHNKRNIFNISERTSHYNIIVTYRTCLYDMISLHFFFFSGSTSLTLLSYMLPSFMYIKLRRTYCSKRYCSKGHILPFLMGIVGFCFGLISTAIILRDLIISEESLEWMA
jgi:hypothetical protein